MCLVEYCVCQMTEHIHNLFALFAESEADIGCNLVVTAATCVQTFACIAYTGGKSLLDKCMDIFCIGVDKKLARSDILFNLLETVYYLFAGLNGDNALSAEHYCVCD